ncbi:MAG TPA: hypothetical protein VGK23_05430 [Methanomassiliicoccales archaeon]|jgi:hypothetical protein
MKDGIGSEKEMDRTLQPPRELQKNELHRRVIQRTRRRNRKGGPTVGPDSSAANPDTPLSRFIRSIIIDYEKWHDGTGYDLDALEQASADERSAIEKVLITSKGRDWRDIEALAELDTPRSRKELRDAFATGDLRVRMAVISYAPDTVNHNEKLEAIVHALRVGNIYGGLSHALDLVEEFHPPEVVEELFRGVQVREGEVAVNFAAMLLFIHGKAQEPFDWAQRPFLLRFNTDDADERRTAFVELCQMIGVKVEDHSVRMT